MSGAGRFGSTDRPALCAAWLLGIAPIALAPGFYHRWGWATLLCVGFSALCAAGGPAYGRLPRWFLGVLAVSGGWFVVTAMAGDAPIAQLFGRAPRYEGLVALPALALAAWTGARITGPASSRRVRRHLLRSFASSALLLAVIALLEAWGFRPIQTTLDRPGSLAGNATDQAILGIVFLAILGATAIGAWNREHRIDAWCLAGALAGLLSVATSASRAGMSALLLVFVVLGVRFIATSQNRRRDIPIAGVALALLSLLVIVFPLNRARLFGADALARRTIGDRPQMWADAWQLFSSSPWLGVGPSGYADAITRHFGDEWFTRTSGPGSILDSPHNVLVQVAVVGGALGLFIAVAFVAGTLAVGVRRVRSGEGGRRDLLLGSLLAVLASGLVLLTHVTSPVTLVPLATLCGTLVSLSPADGASRLRSRFLAGVCSVWLVFVLVSALADVSLLDARRSLERGEIERSLTAFERAQALRPWDADVALMAAQTLGSALEQGAPGLEEPADTWAARAVDALPQSSNANHAAGMVAAVRGDLPRAGEYLARAAELSPADPRIHHELGLVLLEQGEIDEGIVELQRALEIAPESESTRRLLGEVQKMLRR